jgi:uncharacterized metal-binding protein YceD (DUF177 family)
MSGDTGALTFSRPVRVETIRLRSSQTLVEANEAERSRVAAQLDLASIELLEGRYELSRNGEKVTLQGTVAASLHQICVVTLDPFPSALEIPVKLDFAPEAEAVPSRRGDSGDEIDIEIALNEDDPPEPIVDGVIDLGTVTVEFLALALDPYPRKPGVSFDALAPSVPVESPFAALAKLKRDP